MRPALSRAVFAIGATLALSVASGACASNVIFRTSTLQRTLSGSKFRHVGISNAALGQALVACGATVPAALSAAPGKLSLATAVAIRRLRHCPGWLIEGEASSGDVTEALWSKLLPGVPAPGTFGRMFVATLTLEGTDYDRLEWNYSKVDPTAWATWGPYGATIGQSAEIQKILGSVEQSSPGLIESAFRKAATDTTDIDEVPSSDGRAANCNGAHPGLADDYALFRTMLPLRNEAAGDAMQAAFCDDHRFATWVRAFRILGQQAAVRRAYDAFYLGLDGKVAKYLARTRQGYATGGATATEIDLAMGMDGQTQLSRRADVNALGAAVRSTGSRASPPLRRIAISEALPAPETNRRDRCGRDQVFIRGSMHPLPPQPVCSGVTERKGKPPKHWDAELAWAGRSLFTAADVGLRDVNAGFVAPKWNVDFDREPRADGPRSTGRPD